MPPVIINGQEIETSFNLTPKDTEQGIRLELVEVEIVLVGSAPVKVITVAKVQNSPRKLIRGIDHKLAAREFFQTGNPPEPKALVGIRVPGWGIIYTSADGFRNWSQDPID